MERLGSMRKIIMFPYSQYALLSSTHTAPFPFWFVKPKDWQKGPCFHFPPLQSSHYPESPHPHNHRLAARYLSKGEHYLIGTTMIPAKIKTFNSSVTVMCNFLSTTSNSPPPKGRLSHSAIYLSLVRVSVSKAKLSLPNDNCHYNTEKLPGRVEM